MLLNRKNKKKYFPSHFISEGHIIANEKDIANGFNNFFVNIGPNLATSIDNNDLNPYHTYLLHPTQCKFKFNLIDENHVKKIISDMKPKTSSGFDKISLKLLKTCSSSLAKPITLIINQSLATGIFPDLLKIAKVIPIFKKDNEQLFDNYRPISLLPVISKVFEKVVHIQTFKYFTENLLFYKHQYGFREDHSTELASLELVDRLYKIIDSNSTPITVFLDLSKAFDTINHEILLAKLKYYGLENKELKWFTSYLTNRKQFVDINGTVSDMKSITTGVPQGSILGPLLFLIYINDLSHATDLLPIVYADDTTVIDSIGSISANSENIDITINTINTKLDTIYQWLCANKLSLNVKKNKYMMFYLKETTQTQRNLPIKINNQQIDKTTEFKFLGITIDSKLSWKPHIQAISKKISRTCGVLSQLKRYLPSDILCTIYNSLICSHLNYGISSWGFGNYTQLSKFQKRALRYIDNAKYNAHTGPIRQKFRLLTIDDIFKLSWNA